MEVPRLSDKEYLVLDMLRSERERFGLEMVKESNGALKRGTVYVTLSRMVEKGYLKSRQEKTPSDPGLPRRLYSITGEGARALKVADAARSAAAALGDRGEAWA